jgi:acyl-CoA synthetase (AMP-forming)/AMP-acid ligase II
VLATHPAVAEVAVIGVPDERWGESVAAVVVTKQGQDVTAAEIIGFCKQCVAGYKAPKSVVFVPSLPRTVTGKLLKQEIRAPYWAGHQRRIS